MVKISNFAVILIMSTFFACSQNPRPNGSWYCEDCYIGEPIEFYFDNNSLYLTNRTLGTTSRDIKWLKNDQFMMLDNKISIKYDKDTLLMNAIVDGTKLHFKLNRSPFNYRSVDYYCTTPFKSKICSFCIDSHFTARWNWISLPQYRDRDNWEEYLQNEAEHLESTNQMEEAQCWKSITKDYRKALQ